MTRLGDMTGHIRSKNAGPFAVTIDLFCRTEEEYREVTRLLTDAAVARLFNIQPDSLSRYELPDLNALKFSFSRPQVQGSVRDRDMHAAQFAVLLEELVISGEPGGA